MFLTKGLTILAIVCLLFTASLLQASPSSDELWKQSLEDFKNERPQDACTKLKSWIATQTSNQIQSAEALFNLALCSWQSKEPAQSMLYALGSLKLRSSPFKRWSDIRLLQNLQKEIGIRENLPSRSLFIFQMLIPKEIAFFLGIAGIWIFITTLVFRKNKNHFSIFSSATISTCCFFSLLIFVIHQRVGPIAVISDGDEKPLVTFDKSGTPEELTVLPPGTLLEIGSTKQEFTQVIKPIGGWIRTESLETKVPY